MSSKFKTEKNYRILSVLISLLMAICLLLSVTPRVFADQTTNTAVNDVSESLLQVRMVYNLDGKKIPIQGGTSFLINDNTIITCAHVVDIDDETKAALESVGGKNYNEKNISYEVVVHRDVPLTATLKKESKEADFAILTVTDAIEKPTVKLGDSDSVEATQLVYALGFPASVAEIQDKNTYTSSDVTITNDQVEKITSYKGTEMIQHGAKITDGNSGGPLVDENGNVVGINKGTGDEDYHYAISINQVKEVLKILKIEYTEGDNGGSSVTPTEKPTAATAVATESNKTATEIAPTTIAPTTAPDPEPEPPMDMTKLIVIIAIAVLVVVLIVVVILIVASGKKKATTPADTQGMGSTVIPGQDRISNQQGYNTPNGMSNNNAYDNRMPQQPYQSSYNRPQGSFNTMPGGDNAGGTSVLNQGSEGTTVLNEGAGGTTVLSGQPTGFSIMRKRNNEKININKPEFTVGKERRRVDYCISDNNSISRVHAKIRVRAGVCYISDLGSTNGTYINGIKLSPNQETALSQGDKVKLSDEEFEFLG